MSAAEEEKDKKLIAIRRHSRLARDKSNAFRA